MTDSRMAILFQLILLWLARNLPEKPSVGRMFYTWSRRSHDTEYPPPAAVIGPGPAMPGSLSPIP